MASVQPEKLFKYTDKGTTALDKSHSVVCDPSSKWNCESLKRVEETQGFGKVFVEFFVIFFSRRRGIGLQIVLFANEFEMFEELTTGILDVFPQLDQLGRQYSAVIS